MFVIRREQLATLSAYMMKQFEDRMVARLAVELQFVQEGVRKARGYRITAEPDVARFLELMKQFGPDFDAAPQFEWARPILTHAALPGHAKLALLDEGLAR